MKIIFQTEKLNVEKVLNNFASKNNSSGSVISFLGKVRPSKKKKIKTMDIEIYEKMALYQTKLALKKLLKEIKIQDYLIMHRYGNLKPGENIIFLIVASEHRKEGFIFIQEILLYFKKKITFWKKENYQIVLSGLISKVNDQEVTFFLNSDIKNFVSFRSSKLKCLMLLTGVISTAVPVKKTSSQVFKKSSSKCFS